MNEELLPLESEELLRLSLSAMNEELLPLEPEELLRLSLSTMNEELLPSEPEELLRLSLSTMNEELLPSKHEELLRLSLSTGSTYQLPLLPEPQPPLPKSPPHPSLLEIMPPSPSLLPLLHQSPQQPYDFPFPSFHPATSLPETPPQSCTQPQSLEQNSHIPPTDFTQTPEATPSPPPEGPVGPSRTSRVRKKCKETHIESPYPWARSTRAKILSVEELRSRNITVIIGDVRCKRCKEKYKVEYDLQTKFSEITSFIDKKKDLMHSRAPKEWCNPKLLDCKLCDRRKCVEPILTKKKSTNWLFLFLGQMIGSCKLNHLRYYCKYANLHKTGAKNRLVFGTYMHLHRQLSGA